MLSEELRAEIRSLITEQIREVEEAPENPRSHVVSRLIGFAGRLDALRFELAG